MIIYSGNNALHISYLIYFYITCQNWPIWEAWSGVRGGFRVTAVHVVSSAAAKSIGRPRRKEPPHYHLHSGILPTKNQRCKLYMFDPPKVKAPSDISRNESSWTWEAYKTVSSWFCWCSFDCCGKVEGIPLDEYETDFESDSEAAVIRWEHVEPPILLQLDVENELWAWGNPTFGYSQLIKLCMVRCWNGSRVQQFDRGTWPCHTHTHTVGTHTQSPVPKTRAHSSRVWMKGWLMQHCRRMPEFSHPGMQGPWKHGKYGAHASV